MTGASLSSLTAPRGKEDQSISGWWASLVAEMVKNLPAMQRPKFNPWVGMIPWRREWHPTPIFLLGEFHGQSSLAGYSQWGHKKSDMTERLTHTHVIILSSLAYCQCKKYLQPKRGQLCFIWQEFLGQAASQVALRELL